MSHTPPTPGTSTNAGATGRSGTDKVHETAQEARNEASRLSERAKESVREGVVSAREEANRQANRGVERTAEEVSRTSHALETAASEFDRGSLQHQLLHRAAEGLNELSGALRGRTFGEMASEVADFGRRNPAAFLCGAALAGFAIARFARASASRTHESHAYRGDAQHGRYGAAGDTMHQPQQPPTTHTPYGASGGAATAPSTGTGPSTGSSGSIGGASAGSVGGGASAGNPTGTPPGGTTSAPGAKPSTDRGSAARPSEPDPTKKGTPNV